MKTRNLLSFVLKSMTLSVFISGCASMSTMQTARTTDKGRFGGGFGGGAVTASIPNGPSKDSARKFSLPFVEMGARYGLTDKWDIGAKLTLIGTATLDTKYMIIGDNNSTKFAGSVGLGVGYLSFSSGSGTDKSNSRNVDLMIPFYFSYHPLSWLAIYTSPRYVYRTSSYNNPNSSGSGNSNWYGITGGLRLGKKSAFLIECSYFGTDATTIPFTQVTAGFAFGIK
jgi:hypothetical protein